MASVALSVVVSFWRTFGSESGAIGLPAGSALELPLLVTPVTELVSLPVMRHAGKENCYAARVIRHPAVKNESLTKIAAAVWTAFPLSRSFASKYRLRTSTSISVAFN
jgi:hypothetical protein